jgi:cellulose synthase/poly-beta-1,6-N-acetylglucosamine synthase-like glycosyltransferase
MALARARTRAKGIRRAPDQALDALLLARGAVSWIDMTQAREAATHGDLWIGQVLLARDALSETDLLAALADIHGLGLAEEGPLPCAPRLAACLGARDALALDAVPMAWAGGVVIVATSRPDRAEDIHAALQLMPGHRAVLVLAPRARIMAAQISLYGEALARLAEGQAPLAASCRGWRTQIAGRKAILIALAILALGLAQPTLLIALAFGGAMLIFLGNMALKILAFGVTLRAAQQPRPTPQAPLQFAQGPPTVSILVPLYQEREIATTLMAWLARIDYPPERLDVLLAVEADDSTTRAALAGVALPGWARIVTVPPGHPRTKPRAMNFAMNFARGDIIGIYDAEDRPESDQIWRVVQRFAELGPDTACLQGQLDYYNARHNLLARLFAIEYAIWFRVLLPGVQRLGLVVPLGGTTLFLRRAALDHVGGWDAHNVTEDAELGLRLARHGYRTEIIETTTYEEANAAVFPWIRQRARWQKGYLLTWAIAMRSPWQLWRDLGTRRFLAVQVQILFAVAGFLVAPLLWSLMIKPFGYAHPLDALVGPFGYGVMATIFVASVVLSMSLAIFATRAPHLRGLRPFIPLSELYFLLGTLSAWRAAAEMVLRPFFWAKTQHGQFGGTGPDKTQALNSEPSAPLP